MPAANVKTEWASGHLVYSGAGRIEHRQVSNETDGAVIKNGSTTARLTSTAASQSMVRSVFEHNHDGGYGEYIRSYISTAAISADAFRAFATVEDVAAATVRGAHISLSFGTTGTVTGLGVALECTLHIPSGVAPTGTLGALKVAINSDDAASDPAGNRLSFIQVANQGDATGGADVDDDAALLDFSGFTIGSGNMIVATAAAVSHSIRCRLPDGSAIYLHAALTPS